MVETTRIVQEPAADYHRHPAISRSRLWQFIQSRRAFERNEPKAQTADMRLGTLVHSLLLENESPVVQIPRELLGKGPRGPNTACNTKAAKDWREAAESRGLLVMSPDEVEIAEAMANSVRGRLAAWLSRPSQREQSVHWIDERTGLELKCRPDWLIENGETVFVLDLKTTESNQPRKFKRSIEDYGYHVQAAMYSDGVREITGKLTEFYFVGVEKEPPYVCCIHEIAPDSLRMAHGLYRDALNDLRECLASGNFSDPWEEEIISHNLSKFAFKEE